jgi:poly-beta-1,6-N-acetyl-D-glucosamine biosynthesis protein PgaD
MRSGVALIDEASTIEAMRERRRSPGKPVPTGMLGVLTVVFWAVWIYLVLPLVSLLLWAAGVELLVRETTANSYRALADTLVGYSSVLLVLVGLLSLWIVWNVRRYGGAHDRRLVKAEEVTDLEVWKQFRLDDSIGESLREERYLCVDLDAEGCVVVVGRRAKPVAA